MAGLSDTMEARVLNWLFRSTSVDTNKPAHLYYSLHSGTTVIDDGSNEITGGSYARAQLDPDPSATANTSTDHYTVVTGNPGLGPSTITTSAQTGSGGLLGDIKFPTATADWNTAAAIKVFGIWDDPSSTSATHFLGAGTINGSSGVVVLNGVTLTFPGGTMSIQLD